MSYFDELCGAMKMCAAHPRTIFLGQGVGVEGTTMSPTLFGIDPHKRIEFPVAEDLQLGTAIGLSLEGFIPISIFPRWNFMLCCANQLVNHLDRLFLYSGGGYTPKVIIRVAVPSTEPFNPGPQHDDDFSYAFERMLRTVRVVRLRRPETVIEEYLAALTAEDSTILVEYTEFYKNERAKAST